MKYQMKLVLWGLKWLLHLIIMGVMTTEGTMIWDRFFWVRLRAHKEKMMRVSLSFLKEAFTSVVTGLMLLKIKCKISLCGLLNHTDSQRLTKFLMWKSGHWLTKNGILKLGVKTIGWIHMKLTILNPSLGLSKASITKPVGKSQQTRLGGACDERDHRLQTLPVMLFQHFQRWKVSPYRISSRNLSVDKKTLRERISREEKRDLSSVG